MAAQRQLCALAEHVGWVAALTADALAIGYARGRPAPSLETWHRCMRAMRDAVARGDALPETQADLDVLLWKAAVRQMGIGDA